MRRRHRQSRYRKNENKCDVDNEKRTATVLAHHVGESPDIAETDGNTNHRQRRRQRRAKQFTSFQIWLTFMKRLLVVPAT